MAKVDPGELARLVFERAAGDPADALTALAEVTAEFLKLAPIPAQTTATYYLHLLRFMRVPNRFLETVEEEHHARG